MPFALLFGASHLVLAAMPDPASFDSVIPRLSGI